MATKTLTIPAPDPVAACNGRTNPTDPIQVAVMFSQRNGIIGWRKRTIHLLLILLVSVVAINMTLILWIIKILDLTMIGPGTLRILERGIHVESGSEFLGALTATQIFVPHEHGLKLESSRNVTFFAKADYGIVTNFLSLGEAGLQAAAIDFSVRNKNNDILMHIDPREMIISANNIVVSDSGGLRLDGSLETPLVRGGATKDLRLESLLKKMRVRSEKDLHVDSPAGGIFITGLKNVDLRSTNGRVIIDSSRLHLKNLRTSMPQKDKSNKEVFQVCMCENGRIFLANRQGYCQIQDSVCREPSNDNLKARFKKS